jgi:hypothetical protein
MVALLIRCIFRFGTSTHDSQPNLCRFYEFGDGIECLCATCPRSIGLVQSPLAALPNHVTCELLDPYEIALKAKACQPHPWQVALAKFGVRKIERDG